jgi:hypothetical protein
MTVKIFVNWYDEEIISEAEYKERIRQESEKIMADKEHFYAWLEDNYTPQVIWEMTDAGRIEIQGLWESYCKDTAEDDSNFVMAEVEI